MNGLRSNLGNGLRLLFFRRVPLDGFHFSADQWVLLAALFTICVFGADFVRALPEPRLNVFAFADYGLLLLVLTLLGYLLSRVWRDAVPAAAVPVVVFAVALPFVILMEFAGWWWRDDLYDMPRLAWLATAWFALAVLRGFYVVAGRRILRASFNFIVAAAMVLPVVIFVGLGEFWQRAPVLVDDEPPSPAIDGEDVIYRQLELLAQQMAPLRAQRPGVADAYFVGFAGDASQDVFFKEASYARDLWDERYDSRGRSLLLVNNPATVAELPIASATNLKLALRRIGELMDSEEDVLVLFLTSHGSQDFELAVNFMPLALNPLTPTQLKHQLDDAGIKWRIVIVSACYSGGYVAPLQDPYTVVMTAASRDRTSFGCDTRRDFTYFGEAYLRDELARGVPLLRAFERAEAHIREREEDEGLTPSQPQLYVGNEIAARLPAWEAHWRQTYCAAAVEARC